VSQPLLLAIALSATSLGLVIPVLKDAGQVRSQAGQTALAAASIADFAAIVLLSLFFSSSEGSTGARVVVLGVFAGLVAATGLAMSGAARSMRLGQVLVRLQDTTAEIRVRFAVLLLVAFTALAERFGLESILGAFLAGAIVGLVDRDSTSHPHFRTKLEAIGYGFLIPVFFVTSGVRLDLAGLLHSPSALARVPLFLLALLVVRGVPALLGLRINVPRSTLALGLLQATSLPFIVTATQRCGYCCRISVPSATGIRSCLRAASKTAQRTASGAPASSRWPVTIGSTWSAWTTTAGLSRSASPMVLVVSLSAITSPR